MLFNTLHSCQYYIGPHSDDYFILVLCSFFPPGDSSNLPLGAEKEENPGIIKDQLLYWRNQSQRKWWNVVMQFTWVTSLSLTLRDYKGSSLYLQSEMYILFCHHCKLCWMPMTFVLITNILPVLLFILLLLINMNKYSCWAISCKAEGRRYSVRNSRWKNLPELNINPNIILKVESDSWYWSKIALALM